jgi:pre-mRNA 3'-end-processing factor FIP1
MHRSSDRGRAFKRERRLSGPHEVYRSSRTPCHADSGTGATATTSNLVTEYTPLQRAAQGSAPTSPSSAQAPSANATPAPTGPSASAAVSSTATPAPAPADAGPDPSTLPVAHAPPSHPAIDPTKPGALDGRPIIEVDLAALADKAWRRPGSDLSDWFNYGFDEISWETYCYRRREMGEAAALLKASVVVRVAMPPRRTGADGGTPRTLQGCPRPR